MSKISIDRRVKQSTAIVRFFLSKNDEEDLSDEQLIRLVYNSAIDDVDDTIQIYIEHNPQFAQAFLSL